MNTLPARGETALPDLTVYTGNEWKDGICLSTSLDILSQDGPFFSDDCLYLSFAVANIGTVDATPFAATVIIDGRTVYAMEYKENLTGRSAASAVSILLDTLPSGTHEFTIVCDALGTVAESDTSNNTFTRTIDILKGRTEPGDCLLDTLWAQRGDGLSSYSYNRFVPQDLRTGCTPVAVGQVLHYWDSLGYGISLHVEDGDEFTLDTSKDSYTVTLKNLQDACGISAFSLNALLTDAAFGKPNQDEDGTIAALALAGMLIMHSTVDDDVTGTLSENAPLLLKRAGFSYDRIVCTGGVPWERIQDSLAGGMPVLAGLGGSLMHSVVIDGYAADTGRYHVNFGWGAEDERRYETKYRLECGTGWYTQAQMKAFAISTVVVDIHPDYEADNAPASTMDWSRKVYGALEPEYGYLATVSREGDWMVMTDVATSGVNVMAAQDGLVFSAESVTGIAVERGRAIAPVLSADDAPALLEAPDNGLADLFFARSRGIWEDSYLAEHAITGERLAMAGKNRFCDIFRSPNGASVLYLTDDGNGDAFFADDIYTESCNGMGREAARLGGIREIRAGAGDDIVDLTSLRFDCGDGITVRGGSGHDVLWGGGNGCVLFGDAGNDILAGTAGSDILVGGAGNDTILCLGGSDTVCFGRAWGNDTVTQLDSGSLVLWFADGSLDHWDDAAKCYRDGGCSVTVTGGASISLRFGNHYEDYAELAAMGAFA